MWKSILFIFSMFFVYTIPIQYMNIVEELLLKKLTIKIIWINRQGENYTGIYEPCIINNWRSSVFSSPASTDQKFDQCQLYHRETSGCCLTIFLGGGRVETNS